MRSLILPALLASAATLGGCGYVPIPLDPIRYDTSPSEVSSCRRLGPVGYARTDGVGPANFDGRTGAVRAEGSVAAYGLASPVVGGPEIEGPTFAIRLERMRDVALSLGGTDLLLSRRVYRDYSYVEGTAFRCTR